MTESTQPTQTEALRRSFKPTRVRILFVAESPPEAGKFFYEGCAMTTYTARAFEASFGKSFLSAAQFLEFFKTQGCYLDDLSTTPVNAMSRRERERMLHESVPSLADRIREVAPEVVVVVLKRIGPHVRRSLEMARLEVPAHVLPFPGQGHQRVYVDRLAEILKERLLGVGRCP